MSQRVDKEIIERELELFADWLFYCKELYNIYDGEMVEEYKKSRSAWVASQKEEYPYLYDDIVP
ncbi:MAG: hypothetical protein QM654_16450 [Dysgonamonadaceae bacterium]